MNHVYRMTTRRRAAIAAAAIGVSWGFAFSALATETPKPPSAGQITVSARGHVELKGAVSRVDLVAKTFVVKVWGVEWTGKTVDAKFTPRGSAVALTLVDLKANDTVHVIGTVDALMPLVITAKHVKNQSIATRKAGYVGTIISMSPPSAFTFQRDGGGQLTVQVSADTKIVLGDTVKTYADLQPGARVAVRGTYHSATNTFTAVLIQLNPGEKVEDDHRGAENLLKKLKNQDRRVRMEREREERKGGR